MPQPLARPTKLDFTPAALETKSNLPALIVGITNRWGTVEILLCMLLAIMLRTRRHLAASIYYSAASLPLRLELIKSVARLSLPSEMISKIEDITDEVRKRSAERNKVVHCEWATSPDYPDALIRADPAVYQSAWMREFEVETLYLRINDRAESERADIRFTDGLEVYSEKDFRDIIARIEKLFRRTCPVLIAWIDEETASGAPKSSKLSDERPSQC